MPLWKHVKEAPQANFSPQNPGQTYPSFHIERENDAIYQKSRIVARVFNPEIEEESKEIRFAEIRNSDHLLLPDECEFQRYRIVIRKIAYSTKVGKDSATTGRILGGVKAEIVGYRQ